MTSKKMEAENVLWVGSKELERWGLFFNFGIFLHRPFCEMFLCREQIAASPRAWAAGVLVALSALYFCLSQRDPAKVGELLLFQLPCKHSDEVCEAQRAEKHWVWWLEGSDGRAEKLNAGGEGMLHSKMPSVSSQI